MNKYVTTTGTEPWATNSIGSPSSLAEAEANAAAGDVVHIQSGAYVLASAFSPSNAGNRNAPIVWRGYNAAPDDSVVPVVTFDINGVADHAVNCAQDFHRFEYIIATGNPSASGEIYGFYLNGIGTVAYRCRSTNVNRGIDIVGQGSAIISCEIDNWTAGAGVQMDADNGSAFGCFAHDGGGFGFGFRGDSSGGYNSCISARNGGSGFSAGQSGEALTRLLINCLSYESSQYGLLVNGNPEGQPIIAQNCLFINNSLYGIGGGNVAIGTPNVTLLGCAFFGNGSGEVDANVYVFEPDGRLSLPANPIVDADSDDFRVRSQAGVTQIAWPKTFLVDGLLSPWQNYADIGPVQKREWTKA